MFANTGNAALENLGLVVKVRILDMGTFAKACEFHSANAQMIAEYCPATTQGLEWMPGPARAFKPDGLPSQGDLPHPALTGGLW